MGHNKLCSRENKNLIFVKAQHLRRVTVKVPIRIRIPGGLPTVPHTPLWQARRQLDSNLTLRRLMSYIYGAPILDVSRSHTTTQHSR